MMDTDSIRRRSYLKLAAGGGALTGMAGCLDSLTGSDGSDGGGSEGLPDEVTVGWVHSLSGAFGSFGQDSRDGQQIAVDEINDSDDVLPDTELVIERGDTETDPSTGLQAAQELVEQAGVDFLAGTTSSSVASSVAQYAEQSELPFFIEHSTSRALTTGEECRYTNLRLYPHTGLTARASSQFTVDNFDGSVYILSLDYSYGQAVIDEAEAVFEDEGMEIVGSTATPLGNEDFSSIVSDIQSEDPDVIYLGINDTSAIAFFNQLANRGLSIPVVLTFLSRKALGQLTPNTLDQLGELYRGSVIPQSQEFEEKFRERYDSAADFLSAGSYLNTYFYANAVHEAQSLETDAIIDAAVSMTFDGFVGPVEIRECDHQGMGTIRSGRITGIDGDAGVATYEVLEEHAAEDYIVPCSERTCSF